MQNARRFSFGLKEAFLVTALLCIWLGYKVAIEKRAAEMLLRRDKIYGTLNNNLSQTPPNAKLVFDSGPLQPIHDRGWILATGTSRESAFLNAEFELDREYASSSASELAKANAAHLGQGLSDCGLHNENGVTRSTESAARYIATWQEYPETDCEFTVTIDVFAEPAKGRTAFAWVGVFENQSIAHLPLSTVKVLLGLVTVTVVGWVIHRSRSNSIERH